LVELHDRSAPLCESMGQAKCEALSPRKDDGTIDTTHLNAEGSRVFGAIVAAELARVAPELAPHVKQPGAAPTTQAASFPPDIIVAADGSGDFTSIQQAVQRIPKDNRQRIVI